MTLVDFLFSIVFLGAPRMTCEGNTYLKGLPFIINSYAANLMFYFIRLPEVIENDRPDHRIPYMVSMMIGSLLMYGGLASPLNLAWMETFKPFSRVVVLKKQQQQRRESIKN